VRKAIARQSKQDAAVGKKAERSKKKEKSKTHKYTLLKNPENLTKNQKAAMEMLIRSNPRLYRAYLLKESLRIVFKYSSDEAGAELDKWLKWAQRCRIKEFVELGRKITVVRLSGHKKVQNHHELWYGWVAQPHTVQGDFGLGSP